MNIFKSLVYGMLVTSLLVFTACQSNNSTPLHSPSEGGGGSQGGGGDPTIDQNSTLDLAKLILTDANINITEPNQEFDLILLAYSNLNTGMDVKVVSQLGKNAIDAGIDAGEMPFVIEIRNGRANFKYRGPADLLAAASKISSTTFTFTDPISSLSTTLTVNYAPNKPTLSVESPTVILGDSGQRETVTVLAFDAGGQSFGSGTVQVKYPTSIVNGSVSGGLFTENEVSIVNGRATFDFVGPTPLKVIPDQKFEFSYKEDSSALKDSLTISYVPHQADVLLPVSSKTVTTNGETISIDVTVIDESGNPHNDGLVKIIYPDELRQGIDVGFFAASEVAVVNGRANFSYTAPQILANDTFVFKFYHETNRLGAQEYTIRTQPEQGQIVLTSYVLESSIEDGNLTIGLNDNKILSFFLRDDQGNLVDDADISSMTVSLLNPSLADLEDTFNNSGDTLTVNDKNSVNLNLITSTVSGVLPIRVTTVFTDINGDTQTIVEIFNVVVLSGPPTAISISYAGVEHDKPNAKFQEKLVVTVTDKYFNLVNTNPAITVSLIVDYVDDTAGNRIYHGPDAGITATLDPAADTLVTAGIDMSTVDLTNEFLMTFGTGYKYAASGKWDIGGVSPTTLNLIDNFEAAGPVSLLGFAIGRNQREDYCRIGSKWVGNIVTEDGLNQIDNNGIARLTLNYDYYLTGKAVMIAVNMVGYTALTDITSRIGEARKHTLRGIDFSTTTCNVPAGTTVQCTFEIRMDNTGEFLRNANFGYNVVTSDKVTIANETRPNVIDTCANGGVSYVTLDATETSGTAAGTVTLTDILIGGEF